MDSHEKHETASNLVLWYYQQKETFDAIEKEFKKEKDKFNGEIEEYFKLFPGKKSISFDFEQIESNFKLNVTRVQKASIEFDEDKLEKAIGKYSKDVILKRYEITDIFGLIAYLKSCGVDPNIFKSFLEVHKTVDTKALDLLEEKGKISSKDIDGCYEVKQSKPYFIVKKGKNNEGEKET